VVDDESQHDAIATGGKTFVTIALLYARSLG